jgi:hypothetical protein
VTAAPVDALLLPVDAIVAAAAARTALLAAALDVLLALDEAGASETTLLVCATTLLVATALLLVAEAALEESDGATGGVDATDAVVTLRTDPALTALSAVDADPLGCPPDVLTQICLRMPGRCQYCGATSMMT